MRFRDRSRKSSGYTADTMGISVFAGDDVPETFPQIKKIPLYNQLIVSYHIIPKQPHADGRAAFTNPCRMTPGNEVDTCVMNWLFFLQSSGFSFLSPQKAANFLLPTPRAHFQTSSSAQLPNCSSNEASQSQQPSGGKTKPNQPLTSPHTTEANGNFLKEKRMGVAYISTSKHE